MNKLVYIAGPYTNPDPCVNTHQAIATANEVWSHDMFPLVPHLSHFWHTMTPRPYQDWLDQDMEMMRRCDAVFRFPGASSGADKEVAEANRLGIPVFYEMADLVAWASK
jgi:hypothetical protein